MPYGSVGGMERLALTFYNHYKNKGYNVKAIKLIKLQSDIINFGEDEFYLSNQDFSSLSSLKRILFYLTTPSKIKKIIKQEKISHSIAFGDMANIFSSLTFTKEYKIASIHALKSVELNSNSYFTKLIKLSYRTCYRHLDKVVCISNAIKNDLIENCRFKFPEKLEVIYNPHNVEKLVELSNEPIEDKSELKLFSKKTIIFIGRLSIQKSPWHLINAFNDVRKKNKDVNLIFIGDGNSQVSDYINILINDYKLNDNIFFLGRKNNPFKYLKHADVLVLSSHYEGTPNVIVEAIAVGTPVVTSYCTDGIIELMNMTALEVKNENIVLDAGIVTPNLYKGTLGLPENNHFIEEEKKLSDALTSVLSSTKYKESLNEIRGKLLEKFDVTHISEKYLAKNNVIINHD